MSYPKIKEVTTRLWGKQDVHFTVNEDVNIIVGVNGSGKTTLLNAINKLALDNLEDKNQIVYVPSLDNIAMRDKRKTANALTQDLEFFMYDMKTGPSMMYHRMTMIDTSVDKQAKMKARNDAFCSIINNLFKTTGKQIEIEGNKFNVVSNGILIPLEAVCFGEK